MARSQISLTMLGTDTYNFKLCFVFILIMELVHLQLRGGNLNYVLNKQPVVVRWFSYVAALLLITFFGVFDNHQFIYFQF